LVFCKSHNRDSGLIDFTDSLDNAFLDIDVGIIHDFYIRDH